MNKMIMKKSFRHTLLPLLLISSLVVPFAAQADPEDVAAINALQSSNEGNFTTLNNNSRSILQFMNQHMKNDELVQALINYEAAARINEYQYNQQLLFMAAPGSYWAVKAGGVVGQTEVGQAALKISNNSLLASLQPYSLAKNFSGRLADGTKSEVTGIPSGTTLTKDNVYSNYVGPFVVSGETGGLTIFNLGEFMESNNLTKAKISPAQSQQMMNVILDPFPSVDPNLQTQLSSAAGNPDSLTGAAKESIVDAIANNAILSVSFSALSDIISRRTPGTDANGNQLQQSVMETMDIYSRQRFTQPDWYTQLSAASDTAILREIAHMQAYSAWLQFQQFRVQEQQMALLATMNAMMTKVNASIEQLNLQLQKASAQAQQSVTDMKQQTASCPTGQMPSGTGGCVCAGGSRGGQDASGGCPG